MQEEKGLAKQSNQLGFVSQALENLETALEYAKGIVATKVLPKHFYDSNGNPKEGSEQSALLVIQMGNEVGMSTLQAIQQIVPVNNTLSIKGDGAKALIMGSRLCSSWIEEEIGKDDGFGYKITASRKDTNETKSTSFTIDDAKRAGLWITTEAANKNERLKYSPWYKYPKRMLRYRALGFLARDLFSDVLQGMVTLEEAEDFGRESNKVEVVADNGSPITTNADTTRQTAMVSDAIDKVGKRNAPPSATKKAVVEDATFEEVKTEPQVEPVAKEAAPKAEKAPAKPKEAAKPKEEAPVGDKVAALFSSVEPDKMMAFVGANKDWVIAYLDSKLNEKGFVDSQQWFATAKVERKLSVVAEMLVYLRDSTYEKMCLDKFATMVPVPVHEPEVEAKSEESGSELDLKSGFAIPAPFRDFDAQMLIMEYAAEKNKDSNDLNEFGVKNGFANGQSFLENGSVKLMDEFLAQ